MGRIFLAEWDGRRIFCLTPQRLESEPDVELHAATLICDDAGAPAITMDAQGRIISGTSSEVVCWTPTDPQLAAPNLDCFRLGMVAPPTPSAPMFMKHLLELETVASSFCRPLGPLQSKICTLPLLKRFGGDSALAEQFLAAIETSEVVASTSEAPLFLEMLRQWIYGDVFPSLWFRGSRSLDSISTFARTLRGIFAKLGLASQATYCSDLLRCASKQFSGGLYENLMATPPKCLSSAMLELFQSQDESNFVVHCSEHDSPASLVSIPCHSEILRVRWPFFNALFESGLTEAKGNAWKVSPWGDPTTGGLSSSCVKDLLQYFYTDDVSHIASVRTAVQLLAMRDYYMLDSASGDHASLIQHCQYAPNIIFLPHHLFVSCVIAEPWLRPEMI